MEERELHDAITAYIHTYIHALLQTHIQRDTYIADKRQAARQEVLHTNLHTREQTCKYKCRRASCPRLAITEGCLIRRRPGGESK